MVMFGCHSCGNVNRPARRFCGNCGTLLGWLCPYCGFFNFHGERFCGECGRAEEHSAARDTQSFQDTQHPHHLQHNQHPQGFQDNQKRPALARPAYAPQPQSFRPPPAHAAPPAAFGVAGALGATPGLISPPGFGPEEGEEEGSAQTVAAGSAPASVSRGLPPGVEPVPSDGQDAPGEKQPEPPGNTLSREIKQYLQTMNADKEAEQETAEDLTGTVSQDDVNKLFG